MSYELFNSVILFHYFSSYYTQKELNFQVKFQEEKRANLLSLSSVLCILFYFIGQPMWKTNSGYEIYADIKNRFSFLKSFSKLCVSHSQIFNTCQPSFLSFLMFLLSLAMLPSRFFCQNFELVAGLT